MQRQAAALSILGYEIDDALAALTQKGSEGDASRRVAPDARFTEAARFASIALTALLSGGDWSSPVVVRVGLRPDLFDEFGEDDANVSASSSRVDIELVAVPEAVLHAKPEHRAPLLTFVAARAYVEAMRELEPRFLAGVDEPARAMLLDALRVGDQQMAAARVRLSH